MRMHLGIQCFLILLVCSHPGQVGDVQRLIDGQTKLREELWNDVDRVRNELRMETASRKEDGLLAPAFR